MFGRFGIKNRVEEDLARIRRANLPDERPDSEHAERTEQTERTQTKRQKRINRNNIDADERIGIKDILAMIIAALSIVLPYLAAFVAILGLFVWMFTMIF